MADAADTTADTSAWDREALRDPHGRGDKAARVEAMFDAIAPTYELVNTVVSLGRDAAWRRTAVAAADVRPADVVLDVACGTGDMIRAFASAAIKPARIIGVDFSANMLAHGVYSGLSTPIHLCRADALRLPLADASVDVITCVFGVRNFQDLQRGLCEMARVARSGARVVIFEFATPENALLGRLYRFYVERLLPRLAAVISRDKSGAYRYLPRSVETFDTRQAFAGRLEDAGFTNVTLRSMNLGGVVLYRGAKAGN